MTAYDPPLVMGPHDVIDVTAGCGVGAAVTSGAVGVWGRPPQAAAHTQSATIAEATSELAREFTVVA